MKLKVKSKKAEGQPVVGAQAALPASIAVRNAGIPARILLAVSLFLLTAFCLLSAAHAQTGGPYDLTHNVIATGGGSNSTGGVFSISGTAGQPAAGVSSTSFPPHFDLHGGFWFQNLAPTSAGVSITGRVTTAAGNGIRGVRLILTVPDGTRRSATTTTFGYYAFDGLPAGNTYVLEISARQFVFANPSRVFSLQDHLTGMDFSAMP